MSSNVGLNIWFAGAFAGLSANLLAFPLDTLKTRLQSPTPPKSLTRNLYNGIGTVLLTAVPSSGVFFTVYESLKHLLPHTGLPTPVVHSLSSAVAQLANCAVLAPAEVLKQNAQVLHNHSPTKQKGSSSPTLTVLRTLKHHPASLWRGYTALAARDLPFTALQFPLYERLRAGLVGRRARLRGVGERVEKLTVFERARIAGLSAAVAGSAAAWVTTPLDAVKTRMMLAAHSSTGRSAVDVGSEVLRQEGLRGLFRGGGVRAAFTVVGNGLFMGAYEGAKLYLQGD